MKRHSHDSICVIEGLFNTISVMHINIQVKDSWINFKKLKNADNYIVDITKTAGFSLLSMVISSSPVDSDVR